MSASKQELSAHTLQRKAGLGRYQTAWAMPHKFRTGEDPAAHRRPTGDVEGNLMAHIALAFPRWWMSETTVVMHEPTATAVGKICKGNCAK